MTEATQLAEFVAKASYEQISDEAVLQLKIRIIDALGVAIASQDAEPTIAIRALLDDLGGTPQATFLGGGRGPVDRAAFYNGALSRYLDFSDSYLGKGETNHPSDNIGAVLAAAESVGANGKDFLTAVAVAYQVQIRLSDVAPVRAKGFDHTTQGAYAAAAAAAKALRLSAEQIQNAIAIAGTANNALRVTRTGNLSNWKGLAYPNTAKEGVFAALLASRGITGPEEVFEGNKGFKDSIAGPFEIDWSKEDLEKVRATIIKKHNAEIHSQSAIDAALELREQEGFDPARIAKVELTTFDVAFSIIGGGEEGSKHNIRTKEEADHSLPYLLSAALLDGEVWPDAYRPERIVADDIQTLLQKVSVRPDDRYSARFPQEVVADLTITLDDGRTFHSVKNSYKGFHADPEDWAGAVAKFRKLALPFTGEELAGRIAQVISEIEQHPVSALTEQLAQVSRQRATV